MFTSRLTTIGALAAFAASVSAHGTVQGISTGGQYYTGYLLQYAYETTPPASVGWTEDALDNGYVSDYSSPDIICHKNATNAQISVNVTAGDDMTLFWTAWPDSHKGPVTSYLADCKGSCATVDKTALEFVKFDEAGLITPGSTQVWASDRLIANNNSQTVTIPSNLAPGSYVLRHEILALHGAESANGAQAYPFCINLEVAGTGTASPAGTLGEHLYTATDPGVMINIYQDLESYTIPGPAIPAVFGGNGTGSSSNSSSSAPAVPSASATPSAASVPPYAANSSTAAVPGTATASGSLSSVTSLVAIPSAPAVTATATTAAVTGVASASSIASAISSLATALPSSVLASAAPTATATTSSGTTVSTAGMTVSELLDMLRQILVELLSSSTSTTSTKVRRHAREF